MSQYQQALRDCDKAIQMSFQFAEVYKERAVALSGLRKWPDALKDADQYLKLAPQSKLALAHKMRGCIELRLEKFAAAIVDFNTAIQIDRNDCWLYLYRAWAYCGFGVYEPAVRDCTKCLALLENTHNSNDWRCKAFALALRTQAHEKLGLRDIAREDNREDLRLLEQSK